MTPGLTFLKGKAQKKGTPATSLLQLTALRPELSRPGAKQRSTPAQVLLRCSSIARLNSWRRCGLIERSHPAFLLERLACNFNAPHAEKARRPLAQLQGETP